VEVTLSHLSCPFAPWRPTDGRLFEMFAYDTETTAIDHDRPSLTPAYVLGAACDGERGVFVSRDNLRPFFQAHQGVPVVMHHAAFDLRVTDALLRPELDVYRAVDDNRVWDTQVLKRLYALATAGHTARGESGLADCARAHLGVDLDKGQADAQGRAVRTGFGAFLGLSPAAIPARYLTYLARDALATWHLFGELHRLIRGVLQHAPGVWGYVDDAWLRDAVARFGPLTHHVQLKASVLMDALTAAGVGIDPGRQQEKARRVQAGLEACRERLRRRGYLPGQEGSGKALQSILEEFRRRHPGAELRRSPAGRAWSTAEEDLLELAAEDDFFGDLLRYRAAEKLLSTYLVKMGRDRLNARFGSLLETGRTYCGGGLNLQNLPKEKGEADVAATVRGCFVPAAGHVFLDADYGQVELVVLGYVLQKQFGLRSRLAELINAGQDVHRLIAAAVLSKPAAAVSKPERDSAKPVSFGRPGGMGAARLQGIAKGGYGIELSLPEVAGRIEAYHALCPELDDFLTDEVDVGRVLARALGLTPAAYRRACGGFADPADPENAAPAGWLGGMLLKVLRDAEPVTQQGAGRPYTPVEIAFLWEKAQELPAPLAPELRAELEARRPGRALWEAVRAWAGRRPVFTVTGRLRAQATFCSSRNCVFQGPAADGAILGLWRVWRAGHKVIDFVHDQVVVEAPADATVPGQVQDIERGMREGMGEVVPGMRVAVETVVTRSLNKKELDPRYAAGGSQGPAAQAVAGG
jgi:hypothetical protein